MNECSFNMMVEHLQDARNADEAVRKAGIDIYKITDNHHKVIDTTLRWIFGEGKVEVLYWYLYEYRKGKMKIYKKDTKEVLFNFDKKGELYRYMVDGEE